MTMRDLSDDELLCLAQQGVEAAFEELMRRSSSTSLKLALSILRDREAAEDEVQNSYWNAWRSIGKFQGNSKFSTWVSRIVINQCLMRVRDRRRAIFQSVDERTPDGDNLAFELRDQAGTPEEQLGAREMTAILRSEIRKLPSLLRTVLVLRDLDQLEMADVAGRLGVSMVAAKSRLMRARLELKRRMERHLPLGATQ